MVGEALGQGTPWEWSGNNILVYHGIVMIINMGVEFSIPPSFSCQSLHEVLCLRHTKMNETRVKSFSIKTLHVGMEVKKSTETS